MSDFLFCQVILIFSRSSSIGGTIKLFAIHEVLIEIFSGIISELREKVKRKRRALAKMLNKDKEVIEKALQDPKVSAIFVCQLEFDYFFSIGSNGYSVNGTTVILPKKS